MCTECADSSAKLDETRMQPAHLLSRIFSRLTERPLHTIRLMIVGTTFPALAIAWYDTLSGMQANAEKRCYCHYEREWERGSKAPRKRLRIEVADRGPKHCPDPWTPKHEWQTHQNRKNEEYVTHVVSFARFIQQPVDSRSIEK